MSRSHPEFIQRLMVAATRPDVPEEDEPLGRLTREFFANNWANCRDGLLTKTERIRVWPELFAAPRIFRFEIDAPFKRKLRGRPVELMPGPIRGQVVYRGDLFLNPEGPSLAVTVDTDLSYFHPNYQRESGFLCIGDLSGLPGPLPLDRLLENHVYPILTYQNRRPSHAADIEAAQYFALEPTAMDGLTPVLPLY